MFFEFSFGNHLNVLKNAQALYRYALIRIKRNQFSPLHFRVVYQKSHRNSFNKKLALLIDSLILSLQS